MSKSKQRFLVGPFFLLFFSPRFYSSDKRTDRRTLTWSAQTNPRDWFWSDYHVPRRSTKAAGAGGGVTHTHKERKTSLYSEMLWGRYDDNTQLSSAQGAGVTLTGVGIRPLISLRMAERLPWACTSFLISVMIATCPACVCTPSSSSSASWSSSRPGDVIKPSSATTGCKYQSACVKHGREAWMQAQYQAWMQAQYQACKHSTKHGCKRSAWHTACVTGGAGPTST